MQLCLSALATMMATSTFALATSSNCAAVVPGTQCLRAGGGGWTKKIESGPAVESLGACCDACSNHSQCKAFEIIREHGKSTNGCWLVDSFRQKDDPLANCSSAPAQLPPRPDAVSGVWMQHGSLFDMTNLTFLRGGDLFYTWAELETSNGTWDFSNMDSDLALAAGAGFKVVVAIMVGPMSPKWIYEAPFNVPDVKMQGEGGNYPYYLDETYQELFMRAVRTFAEHITSLPSELRSRIVAAQPQFGSTGDDCPWHPTPKDPKYDISTDQWHNFTMSYSPDVCAAYKAANVRCLWNTHIDLLEKLLALCPGSYIKAGMVSHGFQVNFEADNYEEKGAICHAEDEHCRGESWPFMVEGYWLEAPVWSTYWHLLWQLTFGVDMPQLSQPSLVNPDFAPYYEFFNKYAASVRPPANKWVGGFVALRDGLDSANWTRFPNETFGDAKQRNIDRLKAIRDAFKSRGAKLGDPVAASSAAMHSRERNSTNDVGWRIWQGNYGTGRIVQIAPARTSVGYWNLGPKKQPYGRFARGFNSSQPEKSSMGFAVDRRLWGGLPFTDGTAVPLTLRVVYYDGDKGSATFEVQYDAQTDPRKVAATVTTKGSGKWSELVVNITDARFAGRAGEEVLTGADVVITQKGNGGEDAVLHMLEIYAAQ